MSIGDGHVRKNVGELTVRHSIKQKDFCEEKAKILSEIINKNINVYEKIYNNYGCVRFSLSHPYLKEVREFLYKDGIKTLDINILQKLSDESIAIWYMDDGSLYWKKRNGKHKTFEICISTCCSTIDEAKTICDFFNNRYDINMTIKKMKGRFSIRCGANSSRKMLAKLKPYCLKGMEYKFDISRNIAL